MLQPGIVNNPLTQSPFIFQAEVAGASPVPGDAFLLLDGDSFLLLDGDDFTLLE
jgi:hypothetical protein